MSHEPHEKFGFDARVIYEHRDVFDDASSPYQFVKIGVAFGREVFWTGTATFPGDDMVSYGKKVAFATELARRWNVGGADA